MDDTLRLNLGVRVPYFERELNQYCYTQVSNGTQYCTTQTPNAPNALGQVTFPGVAGGTTTYLQPYSGTKEYDKILPNVGVSLEPWGPEHVFYASYAKGFSAPRTDNLYNVQILNVEPEQTDSFDLGYRFQGGPVTASAALWKSDYENRIVTTFDPDLGFSVDRNVGAVDLWGFDAAVGVQIVAGLSLYGSASYNHSEVQENLPISATTFLPTAGKQLVETPEWTLASRAEYAIGPFTVGVQGKYVDERWATDVNDQAAPSYTIFDADARFDFQMFGRESFVQLNVINLTDKEYLGSIATSRFNTTVGTAAAVCHRCAAYGPADDAHELLILLTAWAVRYDRLRLARHMFTRRHFIHAAGIAAGFAAAPGLLRASSTLPKWQRFPFALGVASGTPAADGFVIWTRLAPEPLSADPAAPGGMPPGDVAVRFEIAEDEAMRRIVQTGEALAETRYAHSVHALVRGLKPGRPYWYRFSSGAAHSSIGRALTLPAAGAALDRLRVGYVSCSNYEQGYFAAYRHLAEESPDVVLYLGDYIYEYIDKVAANVVRRHSAASSRSTCTAIAIATLNTGWTRICSACTPLRRRWSPGTITKSTTTMATCCRRIFRDPAEFSKRRAAAYQAYYEHMPVTPARPPDGPFLRIYDRCTFGNLAEISMADTRQYRSRAACYAAPDRRPGRMITPRECPELFAEGRSILGQTRRHGSRTASLVRRRAGTSSARAC